MDHNQTKVNVKLVVVRALAHTLLHTHLHPFTHTFLTVVIMSEGLKKRKVCLDDGEIDAFSLDDATPIYKDLIDSSHPALALELAGVFARDLLSEVKNFDGSGKGDEATREHFTEYIYENHFDPIGIRRRVCEITDVVEEVIADELRRDRFPLILDSIVSYYKTLKKS